MEAYPDFKELFGLFNAKKVEYIIVGAHALAYHGAIPVFFLGKQEYVANKKASGRKKDLADLEALGEA